MLSSRQYLAWRLSALSPAQRRALLAYLRHGRRIWTIAVPGRGLRLLE